MRKKRRKDQIESQIPGRYQAKISWETSYSGWCTAKGELIDSQTDQTAWFYRQTNTGHCTPDFLRTILGEIKIHLQTYPNKVGEYKAVVEDLSSQLEEIKLVY